MNRRQNARFKIYRDEIKERHTSHWDFDYMSQSEREQWSASRQIHENQNSKPAVRSWLDYLRSFFRS